MFFYIWGIALIIIGVIGIIAQPDNGSMWLCAGIGVVMWIVTYSYRQGSKCPYCEKVCAAKKIGERILDRSNSYDDKGSDGKYHTYENQTVEISYRCKYCGEEWEVEEERKKQLSS